MVQSGADFEKGEDDGTADALAVVLIVPPSGGGPCDDR